MKRRAPAPSGPTLLDAAARLDPTRARERPLAERMRPRSLDELLGQGHLVGEGKLLGRLIAHDKPPSMLLWGPPGSGKTTLAHVIAEHTRARFVGFSAVLGGVPELRALLDEARDEKRYHGARTILFVDEIHRFNKAQQDALLPHVENGTVTLVGATTENPSFGVNAALTSRCKVFHLEPLAEADIALLVRRALADVERGLGSLGLSADDEVLDAIAHMADGDARRALGTLETLADAVRASGATRIDRAALDASAETVPRRHDKGGDQHYDVASAFIKSMRGTDPDAALYWMMRMLDAGDDPLFVSRRMLIFASEDVGNADPRALLVAEAADQALRRLGLPEGLYPLAHACLYLASAPKSDGVKRAIAATRAALEAHGTLAVPKKLRNAPTRLAREEGHGEGYKYAHDFPDHVAPGETYLPDELVGARFYEPTDQGLEKAIADKLARLRGAK